MELVTPGLGLIFWQLISFLIVLFILGKFAWKPILGSIRDREKAISESLKMAETARKETENMKSANEQALMEARREREKILNEALAVAENIKLQARQETSKISEKMIEEAKASIQREKNAALQDLKIQAADLSLQIAEKLLRRNLSDEKSQRALVDEFLKDIKKN